MLGRGCLSLDVIHGQILELYRGALVTVDCDPGYSLVGSKSLYCNGSHWNGTAPTCKGNTTDLTLHLYHSISLHLEP